MQNTVNHLPAYQTNEYLLIISPPEDLKEKIIKIKNDFAQKYKCEQAKKGLPHITLIKFLQLEMMEQKIIYRLKMIAMGLPSFKIEMKGFGSFPSHTVYINVPTKVPILNTIKALRDAQRLMKLDSENKPHFITEPYIAIARKLAPWQYEQSWETYSHIDFRGTMIATELTLLKKNAEGGFYKTAAKFELQNLPVFTTQGQLFS
jgi:2'-5' RNA ligase